VATFESTIIGKRKLIDLSIARRHAAGQQVWR